MRTIDRAPLYVHAYDLALEIERARRALQCTSEPVDDRALAHAAELARRLVTEVAQALTFPAERRAALAQVDRAVVALRVTLRIVGDLGDVSAGRLRAWQSALLSIGRMTGGWLKATSPGVARTSNDPDSIAPARVQRAGSIHQGPHDLRAAQRDDDRPRRRDDDIDDDGFRPVLAPQPEGAGE